MPDFSVLDRKRDALLVELANCEARRAVSPDDAGQAQQHERLTRAITNVDAERADLQARADQLRALAVNPAPGEIESDADAAGLAPRRRSAVAQDPRERVRSEALRALEGVGSLMDSAGQRRAENVVRSDSRGLDAAYITAIASPDYAEAWTLQMTDPMRASSLMTDRQRAALFAVVEADRQRAMATGVGSAGGFAVPIQIDPTLIVTGNGAVNGLRDVANVVTTSSNTYQVVTSTQVAASYDAEASAVSDDTPTFAQPSMVPSLGRAFIPYSFEIGMDFVDFQSQLLALLSDARNVLDANKFIVGTGTGEPQGILAGLTTTQRVQTAGAGVLAAGDIYNLRAAVPARFSVSTGFVASSPMLDKVYRLTGGNSAEPLLMPTRDGGVLGTPTVTASDMSTVTTTGSKLAVYGDLKAGFTIVDRIGFTVETVQNLFDPSTGRPTSQRGLLAYWRTTSKVTNPNALRYLEAL